MHSDSSLNNLASLFLIINCILLPIAYISPFLQRTKIPLKSPLNLPQNPPQNPLKSPLTHQPQIDLYASAIASGSLLLPPRGLRTQIEAENVKMGVSEGYVGLLGSYVEGEGCTWFFENEYAWQLDRPSWHKVCQVLFGVGFVLSFSAVVVQLGYLCFKCRNSLSTTLTVAVAILITTATVLCGVCLGIYSGSSLSDGILTPLSVGGVGGTLAWAFYLGIAAVVAGGVASLMFYVDICFQIRKYGSYDASPQLSVI